MYFLHKKNIPQIPHFDKINIFLCVYWLYSTFHIIILYIVLFLIIWVYDYLHAVVVPTIEFNETDTAMA